MRVSFGQQSGQYQPQYGKLSNYYASESQRDHIIMLNTAATADNTAAIATTVQQMADTLERKQS